MPPRPPQLHGEQLFAFHKLHHSIELLSDQIHPTARVSPRISEDFDRTRRILFARLTHLPTQPRCSPDSCSRLYPELRGHRRVSYVLGSGCESRRSWTGDDMPFTYSPKYQEMVLEQVRAGTLASELVEQLEVSEATMHRWKAQDDIHAGRRPGRSSTESAELRAAPLRISELETELAATRRASKLFDQGRVVRPNTLYPIVGQLAAEGHSCKAVCLLLRVAPSGVLCRPSGEPNAATDSPGLAHRFGGPDLGGVPPNLRCSSRPCRTRRRPRPERQSEARAIEVA